MYLPRVLIIDDLFGRRLEGKPNPDREHLCGRLHLLDETNDGPSTSRGLAAAARAVFCRGQLVHKVADDSFIENDLPGVLNTVRAGWSGCDPESRWALVLLDLSFRTGLLRKECESGLEGVPEGRAEDDDPTRYFGLEILRSLQREFPSLPVVILSSKPKDDVSRTYTRLGAHAFLARNAADAPTLFRDLIYSHGLIPDAHGEVIGHSLPLLLALRAARRMARTPANVTITGEQGTGKELLAKYLLREAGPRPNVFVDCGRVNPQLFSSELFGHKRGAFTGAEQDWSGWIAQADGGDVVLDEVTNMLAEVQAGLLRVIQERQVTPVGGVAVDVNVRFVSITNDDLAARVAAGQFRRDLYDRLNAANAVVLPPLRTRREDLPYLIEAFVRRAEQRIPRFARRVIESETLERASEYRWPGNVRELTNCIENAVIRHPDSEYLLPDHLSLPAHVVGTPPDSLDNLIELLDAFRCAHLQRTDLVGRWPRVSAAIARLGCRLLDRALTLSPRPNGKSTDSSEQPEYNRQEACRLLSGLDLTQSEPADMVLEIAGRDLAVTYPLLRVELPHLFEQYLAAYDLRSPTLVRLARRLVATLATLPSDARAVLEIAAPDLHILASRDPRRRLEDIKLTMQDARHAFRLLASLPEPVWQLLTAAQPALVPLRARAQDEIEKPASRAK